MEYDLIGYILAWHFNQGKVQVNLLEDPVASGYLAMIMPQLIARREYTSTAGNVYQIITKNQEARSNSYYYGPYKHDEKDPWSEEIDWGTQIDLEGCKIDGTHRANSGGTTVNLSSKGRATYLCLATGKSYVALVNSSDGKYGWPHTPSGGGLVDSKEGLKNVGCALTTAFTSAPDGQTCFRYYATMPCTDVKIWITTDHQKEFFFPSRKELKSPCSSTSPPSPSPSLSSTPCCSTSSPSPSPSPSPSFSLQPITSNHLWARVGIKGCKAGNGLKATPQSSGWKVDLPFHTSSLGVCRSRDGGTIEILQNLGSS
eukprot:TRINITY_DN8542_c0_g1_i1.p1 TRINITY_DN8542_c0_g1~~TRINITY_DN8542_c0_g1_i1.p1  ORF type:complete len:314 (-),score=47.23 TRINITY_DN8542_c0_g1_i1:247-1188(-)